jgi:hypothetical protein
MLRRRCENLNGSGKVTIFVKLVYGLALAGLMPLATLLLAQAPAASTAQTVRIVGTVTAINGNTLTIKPDAGPPTTVNVSDSTHLLRAEPGAKSLAEATPIQLTGLAIGDRVLLAVAPGTEGAPGIAIRVVAMKQSDISQLQQEEQADWQRRGVGGLVKTIDPAEGTITIFAGSRTFVIHTTSKTIFRRYAPESIKFTDAKLSSLDQIHPGDQLRARGDRSPGSDEVAAEEVVSGSFRNIAGTVNSVNEAEHTIAVTDLTTKKPIVIHIISDSQMHKLPQMMAEGIAARLRNPRAAAGGADASAAPAQGGVQPGGSSQGVGAGRAGSQQGDLTQILQRAPVVQFSDLHKGDAVMIVATQGTPAAATAVTLLSGVEPILAVSPSASQSMFSASWNLGGGGAAEAAGTP